ncbi:MAG: MarC family protein [Pseudomonadota bacterium]
MPPYDALLNAFATYFVTIDPPGLAAISLGVTVGLTGAQRRSVALRASFIGLLILLAFTWFGAAILSVLGITMPAFRVAGGLLLFYIAAEMVFAVREDRRGKAVSEGAVAAVTSKDLQAMAVFPLAVPLVAGPGAISATILLSEQFNTWQDRIWLCAVLLLVGLILYISLILADALDKFIGDSGRAVLTRLLGILLAALSVQFIADGARQLFAATG